MTTTRQEVQINTVRPYTENGERRTFTQTLLAEFVSSTEYRVIEVVAEEGRPTFDPSSVPTSATFLPEVPTRRFATGEWQTIPAL